MTKAAIKKLIKHDWPKSSRKDRQALIKATKKASRLKVFDIEEKK